MYSTGHIDKKEVDQPKPIAVGAVDEIISLPKPTLATKVHAPNETCPCEWCDAWRKAHQPKPTAGEQEDHPLYFPHRDMEPERIGPSPYPPEPKPTTGERPSILSDTRKFLNNVYEAGKSATATTTREWTVERIKRYRNKAWLANDINAALADAKTLAYAKGAQDQHGEDNAALAAEREKVEIRDRAIERRDIANRDHATVNRRIVDEIQQLRSQLAAAQNYGWNDGREHERKCSAAARQPLVEMLEQVLQETVDARDYPDGPCLNADTRTEIKILLAKVKEGQS